MPREIVKIITVYSIDELTGEQKINGQLQTLGKMVEHGDLDNDVPWFDVIDNDPEFIADWAVKNGLDFLPDGSIYGGD